MALFSYLVITSYILWNFIVIYKQHASSEVCDLLRLY